jgi:hypothetical protein
MLLRSAKMVASPDLLPETEIPTVADHLLLKSSPASALRESSLSSAKMARVRDVLLVVRKAKARMRVRKDVLLVKKAKKVRRVNRKVVTAADPLLPRSLLASALRESSLSSAKMVKVRDAPVNCLRVMTADPHLRKVRKVKRVTAEDLLPLKSLLVSALRESSLSSAKTVKVRDAPLVRAVREMTADPHLLLRSSPVSVPSKVVTALAALRSPESSPR